MRLTLEQVRHVANLARLQLNSSEESKAVEQLSAILDAVEKLNELNTLQVSPMAHVDWEPTHLRPDVASTQPERVEKALANAPARKDSSFAVPKIIE